MQFADFRQLFSLHDLNVLEPFLRTPREIGERSVVFQNAALHLEIVDAARKRIGKRLENEKRKRLAVVVFALDAIALSAGLLKSFLRVLVGMRKHVGKKCEQTCRSDILRRGNHQDRKDLFRDDSLAHTGN